MGRPRTGHMRPTKKGYSARVTIDIDGIPVQKTVKLETANSSAAAVAKRKLVADIAAGADLEDAEQRVTKLETFAEAVARIVPRMGEEGNGSWKDRLYRLNTYAVPILGKFTVDRCDNGLIRKVFESQLVFNALQLGSVKKLRDDIDSIFDDLWRDHLIPENPVDRLKMPTKKFRQDKRPRVLLTDRQFAQFMASPRPGQIVQLMALCSRSFGGMRTSDLHAWDWSHVDLETWLTALVHRPKTEGTIAVVTELVRLVIPDQLKAILHAYWTTKGKPASGPVFPKQRGPGKGERQTKRSHVRPLRDGLWAAGIHVPMAGFEAAMRHLEDLTGRLAAARAAKAKGEVRELQRSRKAAEQAARELDVIQAGNEIYKRADFHSFRRIYSTALARAGVNIQLAMKLAGHSDPRTQMRYVKLAQGAALEAPDAALPMLEAPKVTLEIVPASERQEPLGVSNAGKKEAPET